MLTNCFRFAPRDSVPGLIAKICKYLKDHPGWSEEELEEYIKQFIGQTGVESFNGRTGDVVLNKDDINNLKIASAYFAEGDETIDDLNLKELYNNGVRFVFTNWNSDTSSYDLEFVLEYFGGSDEVVYYSVAAGSGGGNVISVNGKTGIVELKLSDIIGDSGTPVMLCTEDEFNSTNLDGWNIYYNNGYRVVGVVDQSASTIDNIYILGQYKNNHLPIIVSVGATDAYTPDNPPPYPVTSVNGENGAVNVSNLIDAKVSVGVITNSRSPGINFMTDNEYVFGVQAVKLVENAGFYKLQLVNKDGKTATTIYTGADQPPFPVSSVNDETGHVTVRKLIGTKTTLDVRDEPNFPGFNLNDELGVVGAIRINKLIEHNGYHRMEQVNNTNNGATIIYTAEDPPPYPVTSVNGFTGNVKLSSIQNFIRYAPGVSVPEGLTLIYGIPILSVGTLPKGNTMYVKLVVDKTDFTVIPISCITEIQSYIQSSCCIVNNGVGMSFTSEAPEGSTPFSARLYVFSPSTFTIMSLEE